ncbi:hypothetical protein BBBOND_0309250 [Babesia bigemina]|uniref:Uncharacterized protein n=1 Tax=Babesia bigemina TaxID=5866 RepID=A0A061DAL3_BABBI|nr:hypothetical protein BBBOND_0309250 [Babesia bigemina]CDR97022.1 hypothetical protein BBBOND_0309250 [Babesia bigemina]|eukprot:XP_012769208.1 hypothetical protein BBBOND_0309250 [Babesia bigemina]
MAFKETLINMHRENVKGSFGGRLNVVHTLMVLHALEAAVTIQMFVSNYLYESQMHGSGFLIHCILNVVFNVITLIGFIPGTFWLYLSLPFHVIVCLHPSYVIGMIVGNLIFWMYVRSGLNDAKIFKNLFFLLVTRGLLAAVMTLFFKLYLSLTVLWYHLVLERIRAAGGNGREMKSALEIEMETRMGPNCRRGSCPIEIL